MSRAVQVPMGHLVSNITKWNPAKEAPTSILQYIDIASIDREQKKIIGTKAYYGSQSPSRARQLVCAGDILVSTVRPNLNAVAEVPISLDGATASTGYCVLRPNKKELNQRYLHHWVQTPTFVNAMVSRATGASYPAVTDKIIKASKIPLPPLAEQRRIAAILDKADELRTKRRAGLDKLDNLLQSIFLDMFGDPVTNPKGWDTKLMDELICEGPQNGLYRPASDYGSGTPIIRIDSFYAGKITKLKYLKRVNIEAKLQDKYRVSENDILINRVNSREYLGKSAIVPYLHEPTVFESNMMRATLDRQVILPHYLIVLMQQNYIRMQILQSSKDAVNQSSINQNDVKNFRLRVPPLELQRNFIQVKDKLEEIINQKHRMLKMLDNLFHALQQRAFRGEL